MSRMSSSDVKHPIELESLIADLNDSQDCDHDDSQQRGRTFYTQPPRTALQHFHYWLFVKCPRRASKLTTTQPLRRVSRRIIFYLVLQCLAVGFVVLLATTLFVLPSYARAPEHYNTLRRRVSQSPTAGIANVNNEKIFIAASIYDTEGALAGGAWGSALERLIFLLGPSNVYLSIYEDNPDVSAVEALERLGANIHSNKSLVTEDFNMSSLPRLTLPNNHHATKRIAFLAEVRNRALRPLDDPSSSAYHTDFDKLLYLNDIIFDPVDAANLLLSTNIDDQGRTQYRAACALDFIDPFKFYDTFASRDLEGYRMGVPIFPWFTAAGKGQSRRDVLAQKDAVEVSSCWGGMVAFEAKWFQHTRQTTSTSDLQAANSTSTPLRFRAETELFWESSECCLIHADLHRLASMTSPSSISTATNSTNGKAGTSPDRSTQIYMNPYIRVAYNSQTHFYLPLVRRFERLLAPFQYVLTILAQQPGYNPRQENEPGTWVVDRVWSSLSSYPAGTEPHDTTGRVESGAGEADNTWRSGHWASIGRMAQPGGFCGGKQLLLLNIDEFDDTEASGLGDSGVGHIDEEASLQKDTLRAGHGRTTPTPTTTKKTTKTTATPTKAVDDGEALIGEEVHTGRWWSEKVPVDHGD